MAWRDVAIPLSTQTLPQSWQTEAIPLGYQAEPQPAEGLSPEEIRQSWQKINQERMAAEATRQLAGSWAPGWYAANVQAGASFVSPVARVIGKGKYADAMNRWANAIEVAQQERERGGWMPDILERGVRGAAVSALPMVAASMVGGPYASIGVAATQEANRAVTTGKDAGLKGMDLGVYAVSQGVIEALPAAVMQKIGLGGAETLASTREWMAVGIKDTLKRLGFSLAEELPEELVTELSHNIASKISSVDPQALTLESLGQTITDTTVQTVITVGGLGGGGLATKLGNLNIRQEIKDAAKTGEPVSRKQWANWGLPKELGKTAEQRATNLQAVAINLEAEEELIRRGKEETAQVEEPAITEWQQRATDPGISLKKPKPTPVGYELQLKLPPVLRQAWDMLPDRIKQFHGIAQIKEASFEDDIGGEFNHRRNVFSLNLNADPQLQVDDFLHEMAASYAAYYLNSPAYRGFYEQWAQLTGREPGSLGFLAGKDPTGGTDVDAFARSFVNWMKGNASPELNELFAQHFSAPIQAEPQATPVTSVKNEIVDELRTERGVGKISAPEAESQTQWLEQAEQQITNDPNLPDRLVKDLAENPRPPTDVETAVLQLYYRRLNNAFAQADKRLTAAMKGDDKVEQERARVDANAQLKYISDLEERVLRPVGTEAGRALAARKIALQEDMSPAAMARKLRVANGGQDLSATELSKINELSEKIKKLEAKIAGVEAQKKRMTTEEKRTEAYKKRLKKRIGEYRRRIAEGDFAKRKTHKTVLDKKALDLQMELQQAKKEFNQMKLAAEWKQKPVHQKTIAELHEALNASRAILTSFDFSALLRQGGLLAAGHPLIALKATPAMFRAFFSKRSAFATAQELRNRKNAPAYKRSKLPITEIDAALSKQEEAYMGTWAKHIPVVAASERAYVSWLNRARADLFDSLAATLGRNGQVTENEEKIISNYISVITGRGGLGRFNQAGTLLATYFFAPRYVASRFQFLLGEPLWHGEGTWRVRRLIAQEYARTLIGMGTFIASLMGFFHLARDEDDPEPVIELNPLSSDYMKIRIGNTRIDPLAGLSQTTVFCARLITGRTKTSLGRIVKIRGKDVTPQGLDVEDVLTNFQRSKFAPAVGAAVDVVAGENFVGEPTTFRSLAERTLLPMSGGDILKSMQEDHGMSRQTGISLLAMFGTSVQTYSNTTPGSFAEEIAKQGKLITRSKTGEIHDYTQDISQIVAEARRLGYTQDQMLSELEERLKIRGYKSQKRQLYRKRFIQRWNTF